MMIISTLLLAGCNKDGDRYYSEEAVALAKAMKGAYEGTWTGTVKGQQVHDGDVEFVGGGSSGDCVLEIWNIEGTNSFDFRLKLIGAWLWVGDFDGYESLPESIALKPVITDQKGRLHFDNVISATHGFDHYDSYKTNVKIGKSSLKYNPSTTVMSGNLKFSYTDDDGDDITVDVKLENLIR